MGNDFKIIRDKFRKADKLIREAKDLTLRTDEKRPSFGFDGEVIVISENNHIGQITSMCNGEYTVKMRDGRKVETMWWDLEEYKKHEHEND